MSAIPWIASYPEHWQVVPFSAAFKETKTPNAGMRESNLLSLSYGRIIRKDIAADEGLLPESFETYQIVEPGSIVFRLTDLQNDQRSLRTGRVLERGIITSAYGAAKPTVLDARYADYLMGSYDTTKVFYSYGGGVRQSLKLKDIARMPVLVPPLEEQREIADYLDRETAQIDTLIAKQEQLITALRERSVSAIAELVESNDSWPRFRVKDLGEIVNGFPFDAELFAASGDVALVRIRDILASTFTTYIPGSSVPDSALIRDGDVVIGMDGDFNSRLWTRGPAALNQRVCLVRTADGATARFLAYAIPRHLKEINDLTYSTTVKHLSSSQVGDLRLAIPDLAGQARIVDQLDEVISNIYMLIAKAEQFVTLAKLRRAALIASAVSGRAPVGSHERREA